MMTGPLHPLAIPATLHDSLMARLDRLAAVKALAQLGATLGREFSYTLLRAVAPWDEGIVHQGLHQLVDLPPSGSLPFVERAASGPIATRFGPGGGVPAVTEQLSNLFEKPPVTVGIP